MNFTPPADDHPSCPLFFILLLEPHKYCHEEVRYVVLGLLDLKQTFKQFLLLFAPLELSHVSLNLSLFVRIVEIVKFKVLAHVFVIQIFLQ